ncbi:vacuolar import and degradation protein-domain-containing protein [Crucibulum laeve]|uniref:Vacuolar import and degradation protein-domain-containing protein n=1 Tax=Crucibulum laeve TaxID=68775 RepID=A0A5C3MAH7_9AGAR|nr:vacuolar import and degradation protein-domain-containing protein [Crucibulum laeve]
MPAFQNTPIHIEQSLPDPLLAQVKVCSACNFPLQDPAPSPFPTLDHLVCTRCSNPNLNSYRTAHLLPDNRPFRTIEDECIRQPPHEAESLLVARRAQLPAFDSPPTLPSPDAIHPYLQVVSQPARPALSVHTHGHSALIPQPHTHQSQQISHAQSSKPVRRSVSSVSSPDPLTDITRLRVRSQGHHCLYPGATFQGTQKSGRNSYDVNVTIVDVDFSSSFLCGYLRIRGLTDDWPELTTYFDAEIIGSRHGFLTQNWGASENEDMVHWSRFPAFKHVKHEAKKPRMTIDDRDRGAVFMRWKERFLVPDHRVQDINGASFAGFYYVCVDFNPPATNGSSLASGGRSTSQPMPLTPESDDLDLLAQPIKTEAPLRTRRDSSVRRRTPSLAPLSPPVATMSGFYYHQNSEPYQQLSLCHVPESTSSSFEFR